MYTSALSVYVLYICSFYYGSHVDSQSILNDIRIENAGASNELGIVDALKRKELRWGIVFGTLHSVLQ